MCIQLGSEEHQSRSLVIPGLAGGPPPSTWALQQEGWNWGANAMETALDAWNEDGLALFSVYSAIMKRGWGVARD